MSQLTLNKFSYDTKPTLGVEYSKKTIVINGTKICVSIWDTAGQVS